MATNRRSLIDAMGPFAAGERVLRRAGWSVDAESLMLAHWRAFEASHLLTWLAHEPPGESSRPHAHIVERIAATLPGDLVEFSLLGFDRAVANVYDEDVRDEIVERLRERLDDAAWTRLTAHAVGGPVFIAVRDCELKCWGREGMPPSLAFVEGQLPCSLIRELFPVRRDDAGCLKILLRRAQDPRTQIYALWVLTETKLLGDVGAIGDVFRGVPVFAGSSAKERLLAETLMGFARQWPNEGALRGWLIDHWVKAIERGIPWEGLWWEIDPRLRDEVALRTPADAPLPLFLNATSRQRSGSELWARVIEVLDGADRDRALLRRVGPDPRSLTPKVSDDERQRAEEAFDARGVAKWLASTPLPQDADDALVSSYVELARRWSQGLLFDRIIVDRLLALPLTPSLARTILTLSLVDGSFWSLSRCVEIAESATRDGAWLDVPISPSTHGTSLVAFRMLVGEEVATRRLFEALDAAIEEGALDVALDIAAALPNVDEGRRARMRELTSDLPIAGLAAVQEQSAWILTEDDVIREADRGVRAWGVCRGTSAPS